MRRMFLLPWLLLASGTALADATPLPAEYRHARVHLVTVAANGETLVFYTDTGGGFNAITREAAERAGLEPETVGTGDQAATVVGFPAFRDGKGIPSGPAFMDGRLVVVDEMMFETDGFLGGRWFADRTWEFDYPAGTLRLLTGWQPPDGGVHRVPLGFQANAAGERSTSFARMPIEIDGERIHVLLDTGATSRLSASAAAVFGLPPKTAVGTSFIIESVFDRWVKRHPDWQVAEAAEEGTGFPMIRVPEVTVAGHVVGPVWFTRRPDRAFREYMSQWMDAPVDGAIGGSAFKYFRMVVDYPGAEAWFFKE